MKLVLGLATAALTASACFVIGCGVAASAADQIQLRPAGPRVADVVSIVQPAAAMGSSRTVDTVSRSASTAP
ncbi:hypothetical protein M6D93_14700 [Jatrophihabitans telluris]|uniref:Uncharacterized protein n=1 Tax=Jatrophihabitans telluris TaxID=2038343 RepID=A0ABY4QXI4_9ACTN|nr:hypothetical protein [Jatrophihabitans telluris]UQX87541.1 hypothetical protein M6D93_14700 [Jatrophihabitans telluris]